MSRHLQALEKSSAILPEKPQKGHPFLCTVGFIPISQEMRYGLKIKKNKQTTVLPVWTGPHTVVLATPTAVKVIGVIPWIHHTRVKKSATSCDEDTWKAVWDHRNFLKIWFQRQWPSPLKDTEPCCSHSGS